jgi:sugar phosphate isomerase/epimerase
MDILKKIQVNMPFPLLLETLGEVLEMGLQPEIYFSGWTLDRLSTRDVEKVSGELRSRGVPVTFHAPFMDLNPGAVDEKVREVSALRLTQVLDLVPYFQPRAIVCHPGYDRWRYDNDVDLWLKNSLSFWQPLVERAGSLSARLALENVFEHEPASLQRLLDAVDSPHLGYCLDAGHGNLFSEVPLKDWIDVLGSRLFETHLHDNTGKADDHLPLGQGEIDFPGIFALLRARNLRPIYTIEPHTREHLAASLKALEAYL